MSEKTWYVYLLECADRTLYTGITTDLQRREHEHNEGKIKGARYTRARRPVRVIYSEQASNRSEASQREAQIKKLTRKQKQQLISSRAASR